VFYRRRIGRVDVDQDAVALEILSLDDSPQMTCRYDAVVLATGYNRQHHKELLKPLQKYFVNDEVGRDYRVETTPDCEAGIFLQGCCEATHGLSDTLLSVLPIRAKEIVSAMSQTVTAG
jgi:L-ornithine N5-oxygenase